MREPVQVPMVVPEQVIPEVVVPKPQPVVDISEAEDVIEPAILAPVVVPGMDDEDIDEDPEERDQIDEGEVIEDIEVVAPGPAPVADIAQIAAVWAAEIAAQPEGFVIGNEELAVAIVEAQTLANASEIAEDDLDDDKDMGDDDDLMDGDDLMDDNDEIAADLPKEMTFGPDDDIPPYESD